MVKNIVTVFCIICFCINLLPIFSLNVRADEKNTVVSQKTTGKKSKIFVDEKTNLKGIKEVTVTTSLTRVVLEEKGGLLKSLFLESNKFNESIFYRDYKKKDKLKKRFRSYFTTNLLFPSSKTNGFYSLDDKNFKSKISLDEKSGSVEVSYELELDNVEPLLSGLKIIKKYKFYKNEYMFDFSLKLANNTEKNIVLKDKDERYCFYLVMGHGIGKTNIDDKVLYFKDNSLITNAKFSFKNDEVITKKVEKGENIKWAGISDDYFISAMIPKGAVKPAKFFSGAVKVDTLQKQHYNKGLFVGYGYEPFILESGQEREYNFKFYTGPKSLALVSKYGLGNAIDYNIIQMIILKLLLLFYKITHNYGLAIICMTLVVKAVLYPLNSKQAESMKQMQKIQPQIQKINERYKDDVQKKNQEIMKLYQEHSINPFAGCLPLLLQLPIFIALFSTLRVAVELKNEPFLWLKDLSAPDHMIILPVLIAVSMYYQQKMMSGDAPQQNAMLTFMPVLMFFISQSLPSGVLVYWVLSTGLTLGHQLLFDKKSEKPNTSKSNEKENA